MTLSTAESGRTLGPEQVVVLEELGRRAAVAVDSARCTGSARRSRARCRSRCCRRCCRRSPGIEAAALYRAAGEGIDVGGDFYDLFSVAEDEWIAVIGDVCGKGAEAAAVTALARYTIRTAAVRRRSPAAILRWLNDAMCRQDLDGRFCTIACVHLDTSRPAIRVTVACGGHPPALLRRADGEVEELGAAGHAARARARPAARGRARGDAAGRRARALHGRHHRGARAGAGARSRRAARRRSAAAPGGSAQAVVERLSALAVGKEGTPPRDDIAILALRVAVGETSAGCASVRLGGLGLQVVRAGVAGQVLALEVADLVAPWRRRAPRRGPSPPWPRPCAPPCGPAAAARRRR